ncbi:Rne/Rng family ribonuclease [Haloimpatiens sp. FM7330]|uniref:Rne/Rng family ribonuclease n=1 Tax=Haloimpatiens sp. FM7330 TaxID=3298610 RepID=UPI00362B2C40
MKKIFVEREQGIIRIAVREKEQLLELFIEEEFSEPHRGQIYKGIVKNIVPAIKCAFIDIGYDKNCYMYLDDKFNNINVKKGDDVIVEIVKESIGDKGPKVTNAISVAGRYSVINALDTRVSFSRKIENEQYKKDILSSIRKPENTGVILRTRALNVDINKINDEIGQLYKLYNKVIKEGTYSLKSKLIYDNGGIVGKILRDVVNDDIKEIIVNNNKDYSYIKDFIIDKEDISTNVVLYEEEQSLFHFYEIEKEIIQLRNNRIPLKCGGYIVIDKTEAMYVIDVNSGKNTKHRSIKKTALNTNMEAAYEIIRQVKLKNLSGIIIIDFIDMTDLQNKKKVLDILEKGFCNDKRKTIVYPFTQLNLVQISRQRIGKDIYSYLEERCKMCSGNGKRIKLSYLKFLIRNEVLKIKNEYNIDNVYIEIGKIYKKDILDDIVGFVTKIQALDEKVYIKYMDDNEHFKVEPLLFANQLKNMESYKIYG